MVLGTAAGCPALRKLRAVSSPGMQHQGQAAGGPLPAVCARGSCSQSARVRAGRTHFKGPDPLRERVMAGEYGGLRPSVDD